MSVRQAEIYAKMEAENGNPGPIRRIRREKALASRRRQAAKSYRNAQDGTTPPPTGTYGTEKHHPRIDRSEISAPIIQAICEGIRLGNRLPVAARMVGIHPDKARSWQAAGKRGGRPDEDIFAYFVEQIDIARSESESMSVSILKKSRHWAAHLAWLERRHPEHWAKPSDQVPEQVPGPTQVAVIMIPADQMTKALAEPTVVLDESDYDIEQ